MTNVQFGKNIKKLRRLKGFTQQEIAETLNISRQTLSNYELGKREPDMDLVIQFARIFKVTIDVLLLHPVSSYENVDMIQESKDPYIALLKTNTDKVLYVTEKELDMFMKYRTLSNDDRRIVDRILKYQEHDDD